MNRCRNCGKPIRRHGIDDPKTPSGWVHVDGLGSYVRCILPVEYAEPEMETLP